MSSQIWRAACDSRFWQTGSWSPMELSTQWRMWSVKLSRSWSLGADVEEADPLLDELQDGLDEEFSDSEAVWWLLLNLKAISCQVCFISKNAQNFLQTVKIKTLFFVTFVWPTKSLISLELWKNKSGTLADFTTYFWFFNFISHTWLQFAQVLEYQITCFGIYWQIDQNDQFVSSTLLST